MQLNEFINFYFDVEIEPKYNLPVIKEILNNKDKYQIYDLIENMVEYDDNDQLIEKDYDQTYFDVDINIEGDTQFDLCYELYKIFVNIVLKDKFENNNRIEEFTFGVHYLRFPTVDGVVLGNHHYYNGEREINIYDTELDIRETKYEPYLVENGVSGHISGDINTKFYNQYNDELLNNINTGIIYLVDNDLLFKNPFDNDTLKQNVRTLNNKIIKNSYAFDFYCLVIDNNLIKLFSTERGFDAFGSLRNKIFDSLTDEQKEFDTVKHIFEFN